MYTYYANEANGTTMAVYDVKYATNYVYLKEQHIYGAGRIGMVQLNKTVYANGTVLPTDNYSTNTLGNKRYELTNHLGNVNAVITDRKIVNSNYSSSAYYFDFTSTGNTGWTTSGCTSPTVVLASGRLRFNPAGGCALNAYKDFLVATSQPYSISFDLDRSSVTGMDVEIYTAATAGGTGSLVTAMSNVSSGLVTYTFTPAQPYIRVYFKKTSTENRSFYIDNLSIQTVASPYAAVVVMTSDYYPFGMQMPRRHTNDPSYRYGYNGMEKDPEMKGEGNSYTTEFRQYDPRLGRWLSLDPLMAVAPGWSPYRAFFDNPIRFNDPSGLFESRRDAKDYKKEHGIKGRINKNKDGSYSINDKKNAISYSKGDDSGNYGETYKNDGVDESTLVTASKSKSNSNIPSYVPNPDDLDKYIFSKGLDYFAPKRPYTAPNTDKWQEDLADWNYQNMLNIWNNATDEEKWHSARQSIILNGVKDVAIEKMKPVAELYKIQADLGGSGLASGGPITKVVTAVKTAEKVEKKVVEVVWNLGEAVITKKHHNWVKIFGSASITLDDVLPYVRKAVANGKFEVTGVLRGRKGVLLGDKLEMVVEVEGHQIWVGGMRDTNGKIYINNAAVR